MNEPAAHFELNVTKPILGLGALARASEQEAFLRRIEQALARH